MRRLSLIVAEDDPFMRDWLSLTLEAAGARVAQAADGHQLIALLADSGSFDLVISDVRMPGVSGLAVLAMARGGGNQIPFLLITGYGGHEVLAAAAELGALVLQKPFSRGDLVAGVDALCGRRVAAGGMEGA